eukprot:gb/GECG01004073.1/.p1 GENE.gb/GECG01004073.1/~~gb/GECG01004073.1/.p1  ORF type:complete len:103 (+),score=6.58 gb/GECG01004073.1/:1-309(+)
MISHRSPESINYLYIFDQKEELELTWVECTVSRFTLPSADCTVALHRHNEDSKRVKTDSNYLQGYDDDCAFKVINANPYLSTRLHRPFTSDYFSTLATFHRC